MEEACKYENQLADSILASALTTCAEYMSSAFGKLDEREKERKWSVTAVQRHWYYMRYHVMTKDIFSHQPLRPLEVWIKNIVPGQFDYKLDIWTVS